MMLTQHLEGHPAWRQRSLTLSAARKRKLKRIALDVLTLLSMASVLTSLIALRTAIHVWHLAA